MADGENYLNCSVTPQQRAVSPNSFVIRKLRSASSILDVHPHQAGSIDQSKVYAADIEAGGGAAGLGDNMT